MAGIIQLFLCGTFRAACILPGRFVCRVRFSLPSAAMVLETVRASSGRAASEPCAHAPVHTLASASVHRPPTLAGVPAHTEPHPQHTSTSADCAIIVVHEQKLCDG